MFDICDRIVEHTVTTYSTAANGQMLLIMTNFDWWEMLVQPV